MHIQARRQEQEQDQSLRQTCHGTITQSALGLRRARRRVPREKFRLDRDRLPVFCSRCVMRETATSTTGMSMVHLFYQPFFRVLFSFYQFYHENGVETEGDERPQYTKVR